MNTKYGCSTAVIGIRCFTTAWLSPHWQDVQRAQMEKRLFCFPRLLSPLGQITYFSSTQTVVQSSGSLAKRIFSHATVGAVGTSHSSFSIDYTIGLFFLWCISYSENAFTGLTFPSENPLAALWAGLKCKVTSVNTCWPQGSCRKYSLKGRLCHLQMCLWIGSCQGCEGSWP